jgi:TolB-like protein/DNA-binding winged helix-turn-helix (wHTH) protein/thioredoxin-like negative regulator of GroEL
MTNDGQGLYEFGPFRLDVRQRQLLRDRNPISIQPKAFEILLVLVRNSENVVLKDDLLSAVWPDTFVEESNLTQNIFVLRKALGDGDGGRRYIITVPGRGYRFAEKVRTVAELDETETESPRKGAVLTDKEISPTALPAPPPRRRSFEWVLAAIGITALALAGYWAWARLHSRNPANPGRIMLAVLPFQNLTGDPEQEYFADGLTEELITQLGRLRPEQLGVISRTSVMGYKHTDKRLDQIGRELAVQYVLEGSFRRAGDRLRITAQLIQVKDQTHLWSQEYDRRPEDILTVQDEVAVDVARETQLRLTPQQQIRLARVRTVDPEAHEAYLKGRYFWNKRTEEGFTKAIDYFNQAIAKSPNYAEAYAGLADTYLLLGGYALMEQDDAMPKAKAAAQKALAIDGQLAEAYTSLGLIAEEYEWNWTEAGKDFRQAIELDPNYSVAHEFYGDAFLGYTGKRDEAIAELRKAHELDPLSPIIASDLARRLCEEQKCAEAVEQFRKIIDVDPDFAQARYYLSQTYERMGMYTEAIAEVHAIKDWENLPFTLGQLGQIYAVQGRRQQALEIVEKLRLLSAHQFTDASYVARIYAALGEKDLAFQWLQKACDKHSAAVLAIGTDPAYDPLRSDPRFEELKRRIGLP